MSRPPAPADNVHQFQSAAYREGAETVSGAYCPRCERFWPVGMYLAGPCIPAAHGPREVA